MQWHQALNRPNVRKRKERFAGLRVIPPTALPFLLSRFPQERAKFGVYLGSLQTCKGTSIGSRRRIPETSPCDNGFSDGIPDMSHAKSLGGCISDTWDAQLPIQYPFLSCLWAMTSEPVNYSELKLNSDIAPTCPSWGAWFWLSPWLAQRRV